MNVPDLAPGGYTPTLETSGKMTAAIEAPSLSTLPTIESFATNASTLAENDTVAAVKSIADVDLTIADAPIGADRVDASDPAASSTTDAGEAGSTTPGAARETDHTPADDVAEHEADTSTRDATADEAEESPTTRDELKGEGDIIGEFKRADGSVQILRKGDSPQPSDIVRTEATPPATNVGEIDAPTEEATIQTEDVVEQRKAELTEATDDLKVLWDSIPPDKRAGDPQFDEISNAYGGDVDKYVAARMTQNPGNEAYDTKHTNVDIQRLRDAAKDYVGSDKADQLITAAKTKKLADLGHEPDSSSELAKQQSVSETKSATQPITGEADPETTQAANEKTVRTQELGDKIKNGSATEDELSEYTNLKKDPEARKQELQGKIDIGNITSQEYAEYQAALKGGEQVQTPEQQMDDLNNQLEELGSNIFSGKGDPAENAIKMQELTDKAYGIKRTSQELARGKAFAKAVLSPDTALGSRLANKELRFQKEIQEKLQQLLVLETQMMAIPKRLEALRQESRKIKEAIRADDQALKGDFENDQQRLAKRTEMYGKMGQLANVKAEVVRTKATGTIFAATYKDNMQYIKRKLGLNSGLGAFVDFMDAKISNVGAEISLDIQSYIDQD